MKSWMSPICSAGQGGNSIEFGVRFPGQIGDDSGLYYNLNRDYDAGVGRYVQADPIGVRGGLNLYLYAEASPLRYADPTGQRYVEIIKNCGTSYGSNAGITLCDGEGGFLTRVCNRACTSPCTLRHEQQHANDLRMVRRRSCMYRPEGSKPLQPTKGSEYLETRGECRAWRAGMDACEKMECECDKAKDYVDLSRNWMHALGCEKEGF